MQTIFGISILGMLFLCGTTLWYSFCPYGMADENVLGLQTNGSYDVYIGGSDQDLPAVRNVHIVALREIKGLTFLIIQTDSFAGKRSKGLILLNYAIAILPTFGITPVQGITKINVK